jgi:hypothetical protein
MLPLDHLRKHLDPRCPLDDEQLAKLRTELYVLAHAVVDGMLEGRRGTDETAHQVSEKALVNDRDTAISLTP